MTSTPSKGVPPPAPPDDARTTLPFLARAVTNTWIVAMDRELVDDRKVKLMARVRTVFPAARVFPATDVGVHDASIAVSPRARLGVRTSRRDSYFDIASAGAIGCADSHIRIWRRAAASPPDEWTLVFEADACVSSAALQDLAAAEVPVTDADDVSVISLGMAHWIIPVKTAPVPGRTKLHTVLHEPLAGTHGYLLRNRCAQALLDAVLPLEVHVDGAMIIAAELGLVPPIWVAYPAVAFQQPTLSSTIQSDHSFKAILPSNNAQLVPMFVVPCVIALVAVIALAVVLATYVPRARCLVR